MSGEDHQSEAGRDPVGFVVDYRAAAPNLCFDLVERVDALEQIGGERPRLGGMDVEYLAPKMGRFSVTSAAAHDGAQLANVLDLANTAGDFWADTARTPVRSRQS